MIGACSSDTPRCEFWSWGAGDLRPDCCTDHLVDLAVFVHQALSERQLLHWLDYGSLLGAVRDHHLMPWDTDVDFGYLAEDHAAVVRALRDAAASTRHVVDLRAGYVTRVNFSALNDQHADLYPWHRRADVLDICEAGAAWPGTPEPDSFPARFLDRLEPALLEGHRFLAPSPVHDFLEQHRYGPDYLVPLRRPVDRSAAASTSPEELTPSVRAIFAELGLQTRRLHSVRSTALGPARSLRSSWIDAGRPRRPRRALVAQHLEKVPRAEQGPLAHELARALALVETERQELEGPSPRDRLRRNARRVSRLVRRLLRPS